MQNFFTKFHQGGKYTTKITNYQAELRREEKITHQNSYIFHLYRPIKVLVEIMR